MLYLKPHWSPTAVPVPRRPGEPHYFDSAELLARLRAEGRSRAEMAGMTGLSVQQVVERLQLLTLEESLRGYLRREQVPERTAMTLLLVPDELTRRRLAMRIVRERLCVRDAALLAESASRRCAAMCAEKRRSQRVITLIRDARPFHNALRDITSQMNAAGLQASFTEEHRQGLMEMKITYPMRRRCTDRYQSM